MNTAGTDAAVSRLTADDAERIARLCLRQARASDKPIAVAVVDAAGGVLFVQRSRQIHPIFAELTIAKAFTSATFGLPRQSIEEWQREKPWLHVELSRFAPYPIVPMAGSAEVRSVDASLGGVAVTSCGALDDQQVCDNALAELGYCPAGPETGA